MVDLSTTYLGLKLKNPIIVSASPLSENIDAIRQMEAKGAAAIVLYSLFAEQIEAQEFQSGRPIQVSDTLPTSLEHLATMPAFTQNAGGYLSHIYRTKRAVNIPIIASLNGYVNSGWAEYARLLEGAGADAIELNIYYLATQPRISSSDIDEMVINLAQRVKTAVSIPIAVKLSPYFSATANLLHQLDSIGIDGLVLFNRFYQPDFDIEAETISPSLDLSTPEELRIRLRWVALMAGQTKADFGITGGVHTAVDIIKSIMAGAQVTLITSTLYKNGLDHLTTMQSNLSQWLESHNYSSIDDIRGRLSQPEVSNSTALERANYIHILKAYPRD